MQTKRQHTVGRFAPSPSGRMHMGNVYSALLSWLSAKSKGGEWLLRIEDIDTGRSRREYAEQLMDDLQWLGLEWDGVPVWQSERSDIYEQHLKLLIDKHLVYPCHCTRADIMATQAPHESDGRIVYQGTCRPANIQEVAYSTKTEAALRLLVPNREISFTDHHYGRQGVNLASHCGDFVLRRRDGAWAYQLAVVVDDALMGVTEVVRGKDLLLSAAQQIYMYEQFGYKAPQFCHLPLLCNKDGQRLSKRDRSLDMGELRKSHSAEDIIGILAFYAGITDTPFPTTVKNLIPIFSWEKVPTENILVEMKNEE